MRTPHRAIPAILVLALAACGDEPAGPGTPQPVIAIAAGVGGGQTALSGEAVAIAPTVTVTADGQPAAGRTVTFAVTGGGGAVTGAQATSGADGIARVGSWTLGAAGAQQLSAQLTGATGSPAIFAATALVGPVATITKLAGDGQSTAAGSMVDVPPQVRLNDLFGNVVSGTDVSWFVSAGGGSVGSATTTSASDGTTSVASWTLGAVGNNQLDATVGAVSVTFDATATAPAFDPTGFAGTYTGTWTNTTFASVGTVSAVVTITPGTMTGTALVSVTGNVLGQPGPVNPPVQNGAYTGAGAAFTANIPPMGDITASVDAAGNISAGGVNVPAAGIASWTAAGTITAQAITMTFQVNFNVGAPAVGTITLTK